MKKETLRCSVKSRLFGGAADWETTAQEFPYVIANQPEDWDELTSIFGGEAETFRRTLSMFDAHGTKGQARELLYEIVRKQEEEAAAAGLFKKIPNPDWDENNPESGPRTIFDPKGEEGRKKAAQALLAKIHATFGKLGPEVRHGLSEKASKPSQDDLDKAAELHRLISTGEVQLEAVQALAEQYGVELTTPPTVEELATLKKVKRVADSRNVLADFGL